MQAEAVHSAIRTSPQAFHRVFHRCVDSRFDGRRREPLRSLRGPGLRRAGTGEGAGPAAPGAMPCRPTDEVSAAPQTRSSWGNLHEYDHAA